MQQLTMNCYHLRRIDLSSYFVVDLHKFSLMLFYIVELNPKVYRRKVLRKQFQALVLHTNKRSKYPFWNVYSHPMIDIDTFTCTRVYMSVCFLVRDRNVSRRREVFRYLAYTKLIDRYLDSFIAQRKEKEKGLRSKGCLTFIHHF